MNINYISHLNTALSDFHHREGLHATHISLYVALFYTWNQHRFEDEFPVIRETIMMQSKIGSRNTYLRCLKELHNCGLITYTQGFDAINPAIIGITPFGNDGELLIDTSVDRVIFDLAYRRRRVKKEPDKQLEIGRRTGSKKDPTNKQYINNIKLERVNGLTPQINELKIPSEEEVEMYFAANKLRFEEGRKFFLYYQSRGWIVNGNPIRDWESAAQKWVLNAFSNNAAKPNPLHTNNNKNYSDLL